MARMFNMWSNYLYTCLKQCRTQISLSNCAKTNHQRKKDWLHMVWSVSQYLMNSDDFDWRWLMNTDKSPHRLTCEFGTVPAQERRSAPNNPRPRGPRNLLLSPHHVATAVVQAEGCGVQISVQIERLSPPAPPGQHIRQPAALWLSC